MAGMARYPDGYFHLAIVDPPYLKSIDNDLVGNLVMTKHVRGKNFDSPEKANNSCFKEIFRVALFIGSEVYITKVPSNVPLVNTLSFTSCLIVKL